MRGENTVKPPDVALGALRSQRNRGPNPGLSDIHESAASVPLFVYGGLRPNAPADGARELTGGRRNRVFASDRHPSNPGGGGELP